MPDRTLPDFCEGEPYGYDALPDDFYSRLWQRVKDSFVTRVGEPYGAGFGLGDNEYGVSLPMPGPGTEIIIPAWNDIIHLAPPPSYSSYERATIHDIYTSFHNWGQTPQQIADFQDMSLERVLDYIAKGRELKAQEKIKQIEAVNISKSPTPAIAQNFGIIMTAIDDLQDFTTTVGVISRVLGRVFKPAELLAIGSFTIGEFLNRLNIVNRLTGGEKAIVCKFVKELQKSSRNSTIQADVDKRMRRLFPSKGEAIEMLQTTDQLFGVGISLGPLVGLLEDSFFGSLQGSPVRFKEWKITDREKQTLSNIWDRIINPEKGFEAAFRDIWKWAESAANIVVSSTDLSRQKFLKGLIMNIQVGAKMRCTKLREFAIETWDIISGQKATPKKKTKLETKFLMQSLGADPYAVGRWPVQGLGEMASLDEIMNAYSAQSMRVLDYWRNKFGASDDGLFLDACVKEIGTHAAAMFLAPGGKITESLSSAVLIYLHALEADLVPPAGTSPDKLEAWHDWISDRMSYFGISDPDRGILEAAYSRFFVF